MSVEGDFIGELDLSSTRSQVRPDTKIRAGARIDELQIACQSTRAVGTLELTEVFPLPVAPMTLR